MGRVGASLERRLLTSAGNSWEKKRFCPLSGWSIYLEYQLRVAWRKAGPPHSTPTLFQRKSGLIAQRHFPLLPSILPNNFLHNFSPVFIPDTLWKLRETTFSSFAISGLSLKRSEFPFPFDVYIYTHNFSLYPTPTPQLEELRFVGGNVSSQMGREEHDRRRSLPSFDHGLCMGVN